MKMLRLPTFVILFSLSITFTSAALAKENGEDESTSDEDVTIEKTVLAREVEDRFELVKASSPTTRSPFWFF
jgi:hypothetical protein